MESASRSPAADAFRHTSHSDVRNDADNSRPLTDAATEIRNACYPLDAPGMAPWNIPLQALDGTERLKFPDTRLQRSVAFPFPLPAPEAFVENHNMRTPSRHALDTDKTNFRSPFLAPYPNTRMERKYEQEQYKRVVLPDNDKEKGGPDILV